MVSEIDLAHFSDIVYVDLDSDLEKLLKDGKNISDKEFAEVALQNWDRNDEQGKSIREQLEKCLTDEYKDYKIVDYQNNNKGDGFVGMAIKSPSGDIIVTSRGSESPDETRGWEDWIDNFKISLNLETAQQASAKEFINRVGDKFKEEDFYLTGHSKGGNNAIYATIVAKLEIQKRIKGCVTFNAPGFSDLFIAKNKSIIDKLNELGIITEYRQKNDYVSPIMENIGKIIFVESDSWKPSINDHYIFRMKIEDGKFVITKNQEPGIFALLVNDLVDNLLESVPEDEVSKVIELVGKLMDKKSFNDVIYALKESGIDESTVATILFQTIYSAILTALKKHPILKYTPNRFIMELFDTPKNAFIKYASICYKEVKEGFKWLKENIVDTGRDKLKEIFQNKFVMDITSTIIPGGKITMEAIKSYSSRNNKFMVNIEELSKAITVYENTVATIESSIKKIDVSITNLVKSGWSGQSSYVFYNTKFIEYKNTMNKSKDQSANLLSTLKKAKELFSQRLNEESELLNCI